MTDSEQPMSSLTPKTVFIPETVEQASARIAQSEEQGEVVAIIGGGTDLDVGNELERLDLLIRTTRLDRVVEHAPSDQIISVEAGLTLGRLQSLARAHGQRLALDPPLPDRATVGGIVAANAFGPLRTRYGSVRDLIIGISMVRPDGVIAHGGGKVVKNVAGFDLPRLMVGSLGTLGMIATVTFRLHPMPESAETLLVSRASAARLRTLVVEMRQAQLEAAALAAVTGDGGFDIGVRFEGFRAGVEGQRDRLTRLVGSSSCAVLDSEGAHQFWLRHDSVRASGPLRLKIAAMPSQIETISRSVITPLLSTLAQGGAVWYPWPGVGFVTGRSGDDEATATEIKNARRIVREGGGSLTIHAASPGVRRHVQAWGESGNAIALMRSIKETLDPSRRFAPGRFVGDL